MTKKMNKQTVSMEDVMANQFGNYGMEDATALDVINGLSAADLHEQGKDIKPNNNTKGEKTMNLVEMVSNNKEVNTVDEVISFIKGIKGATKDVIKAALKEEGVAYKATDKKDVLIDKLANKLGKQETTIEKDEETMGKTNTLQSLEDMVVFHNPEECDDAAYNAATGMDKADFTAQSENKKSQKKDTAKVKAYHNLNTSTTFQEIVENTDEITAEYVQTISGEVAAYDEMTIGERYLKATPFKSAVVKPAEGVVVTTSKKGEVKEMKLSRATKLFNSVNAMAKDNAELITYLTAVLPEGRASKEPRVLIMEHDLNNVCLRLKGGEVLSLGDVEAMGYQEAGMKLKQVITDSEGNEKTIFNNKVEEIFFMSNNDKNRYNQEGNCLTLQQGNLNYKAVAPELTPLSYEKEVNLVTDNKQDTKIITETTYVRDLSFFASVDFNITRKIANWMKEAILNYVVKNGKIKMFDAETGKTTYLHTANQSIAQLRTNGGFLIEESVMPYAEVLKKWHIVKEAFAGNIQEGVKRVHLNNSSGKDMKLDQMTKNCKLRVTQEEICGLRCVQADYRSKRDNRLVFRVVFATEVVADQDTNITFRGFDVAQTEMDKVVSEIPAEIKEAFAEARNVSDGYGFKGARLVLNEHLNGLVVGKELSTQMRMKIVGTNENGEIFSVPTNKGLFVPQFKACELMNNADVVLFADTVKSKGFFTFGNVTIDLKKLEVKGGAIEFENALLDAYVVGTVKQEEPLAFMASQNLQHFVQDEETGKKLINSSIVSIVKTIEENKFEAICKATEEEVDLDELFSDDYVSHEAIALAAINANHEAMEDAFVSKQLVAKAIDLANQLVERNRVAMEYMKQRYMIIDPIAVVNALEAGSIINNKIVVVSKEQGIDHTIVQKDEVVVPTLQGFLTGECTSQRSPFSHVAEAQYAVATMKEEYTNNTIVIGGKERNLLAGCTIFNATTAALEAQSGADMDGDKSILSFYKTIVDFFKNANESAILDVWFNSVTGEWGTGSIVIGEQAKEKEIKFNSILGATKLNKGQLETRVADYATKTGKMDQLVADAFKAVSRASIGMTNDLGKYANAIMILMDIRSTLTIEKAIKECDSAVLALLFCVRWEVDKAKHGGSFAEHEAIQKVLRAIEMDLLKETGSVYETVADARKAAAVVLEKLGLSFLANHLRFTKNFDGEYQFAGLQKAEWLASQKDKFGHEKETLFSKLETYAVESIVAMANDLIADVESKGHIDHLLTTGLVFSDDKMDAIKSALEMFVKEYSEFYLEKANKIRACEKQIKAVMEKRDKDTNWEVMNSSKLLHHAKDVFELEDVIADMKQLKEERNLYTAVFKQRVCDAIPFSDHIIAVALYQMQVRKGTKATTVQLNGKRLTVTTNTFGIDLAWKVFGKELIEIIGGKVNLQETIEGDFVNVDAGFNFFTNEEGELVERTAEELTNCVIARYETEVPVGKGKTVVEDCIVLINPETEAELAWAKVNAVTGLIIAQDSILEDVILVAGTVNELGAVLSIRK